MLRHTLLAVIFLVAVSGFAAQTDEIETAYKALQTADAGKDFDGVLKAADSCFQLSNALIRAPQPADQDKVDAWKNAAVYAKQVRAYAEYTVNIAIVRTADPAKRIQAFEALEKGAPDSEYLGNLYGLMLGTYAKMKPDRSFQFAQSVVAKAPKDEDALMVLANGYYERKQYDSAANFGTRLAAVMGTHGRPEGMPTGDWEFKRTAMVGRGHWIAGMSYAAQQKYPQAVEFLKASLPFLKGEPKLLAGAQFQIGVAAYNLARPVRDKAMMQEALKFSELAAATDSPYRAPAQQNVYAIKQELQRLR